MLSEISHSQKDTHRMIPRTGPRESEAGGGEELREGDGEGVFHKDRVSVGEDGKFWRWRWGRLHNSVKVLTATELDIGKWLRW